MDKVNEKLELVTFEVEEVAEEKEEVKEEVATKEETVTEEVKEEATETKEDTNEELRNHGQYLHSLEVEVIVKPIIKKE